MQAPGKAVKSGEHSLNHLKKLSTFLKKIHAKQELHRREVKDQDILLETIERQGIQQMKIEVDANPGFKTALQQMLTKIIEYGKLLGPGNKKELRKILNREGNEIFSGKIKTPEDLMALSERVHKAFTIFVKEVEQVREADRHKHKKPKFLVRKLTYPLRFVVNIKMIKFFMSY